MRQIQKRILAWKAKKELLDTGEDGKLDTSSGNDSGDARNPDEDAVTARYSSSYVSEHREFNFFCIHVLRTGDIFKFDILRLLLQRLPVYLKVDRDVVL